MEAISETLEYGSLKEVLLKIYGEEVSIADRRAVHGGDANEAYRLLLSNGETLFLKANSIERADFFRAEAEGIAALTGTITSEQVSRITQSRTASLWRLI